MKKKSIILPAIAGLVVLTSAGAITFASNYQSYQGTRQGNMGIRDGGAKGGMQGNLSETDRETLKNLSETDRKAMMEAIQKTIDTKDYEAFKNTHTKYGITVNITEDQFNDMITKRADMETRRAEKEAEKAKIQEAIKNGDFETRKELSADKPISKYIDTQEKFNKLQEMESYREKAQSIAESLGLPQGEGRGMGMKMGGKKGIGMGFNK
ncbi:hypothetical protein K9M48_04705 [Candidatus Gracilibacteria bacterium]|nr:hypothetical protein [Candidatus Gracilibacteria bacterium]